MKASIRTGGGRATSPARRSGFTLIELLAVMLIIGLLATIALPRFGDTKTRAHYASIGQDFRNLGASQERYYQMHTRYALDLADLDFDPTPGVDVLVTEATVSGWAGVGTHEALEEDRGCAIYLGDATAPALPNGQPHSSGSGVLQCTP